MTKFRLDEFSAVDSPAQEGARALLVKRADVAAETLGVPGMPAGQGTREPDVLPAEATDAERAREFQAALERRDRLEREARSEAARSPERTLADLDSLLEARAEELARDDETLAQAFSRLFSSGDDAAFSELLAERERVAVEGPR